MSFVSILTIDANEKERKYYVHRLKISSPDYQVFEAVDGQSGLELFHSRPFDCVILDLSLPDISGIEVLIKLVPIPRKPEIPVIVLYQFPSQALFEVAMQNGAYVCLHKTATSVDLLDKTVMKGISVIRRSNSKP